MSLESELKKKMGYTEKPATVCRECKFSKEKENPYLDRDWFTVCTYNNIAEFTVNSSGRCKRWEPKGSAKKHST